jgi:hypothetical protein
MPITKSFKPGDCVKLTDVTAASAKIQSMKGENAVVTKMENGRVYVVWDSPNLKAASGPFFASRFTLVSELPTPAAEAPPPAPQANPFKVDDIVVVNDTYDSLPYMVGQIGKVIHTGRSVSNGSQRHTKTVSWNGCPLPGVGDI